MPYWPSLREIARAARADRRFQAAAAGHQVAFLMAPYAVFCGTAARLEPAGDDLHLVEHRTPCLRVDGRYYCSPACALAALGAES